MQPQPCLIGRCCFSVNNDCFFSWAGFSGSLVEVPSVAIRQGLTFPSADSARNDVVPTLPSCRVLVCRFRVVLFFFLSPQLRDLARLVVAFCAPPRNTKFFFFKSAPCLLTRLTALVPLFRLAGVPSEFSSLFDRRAFRAFTFTLCRTHSDPLFFGLRKLDTFSSQCAPDRCVYFSQ